MLRDQLILTGWKEIAAACGLTVYRIRQRAERYRMPYVRLCGRVTIPRSVLLEWFKGLCEIVNEDGGEGEDDYVIGRLRNLKKVK